MELSDGMFAHLRETLRPPATIAGRYELGEEIGRGGMGTVYRARDTELERDVAIKLLAGADRSADARARLQREARFAAALEHPGIVPVYDVGELPDGQPYYVMKFVSGARLDELVRGDATASERLDVFLRICDAVAYAHSRGVVHRDLKPQNVRVGPFGEVQVLDFGVAKRVGGAEAVHGATSRTHGTAAGTVIGTPGWMAPEQARGETDVDARADVYALGALLDALVRRDGARLPRALAAIAAQARAPEREARYADAGALAADVRRFVAGEAVAALPEGPLERTWRFARKHQVAIGLVLAYVAMRALLVFFH